jgi:hypothetical protein
VPRLFDRSVTLTVTLSRPTNALKLRAGSGHGEGTHAWKFACPRRGARETEQLAAEAGLSMCGPEIQEQ